MRKIFFRIGLSDEHCYSIYMETLKHSAGGTCRKFKNFKTLKLFQNRQLFSLNSNKYLIFLMKESFLCVLSTGMLHIAFFVPRSKPNRPLGCYFFKNLLLQLSNYKYYIQLSFSLRNFRQTFVDGITHS